MFYLQYNTMKAVYIRCSTDKQDFCQQQHCINQYLERINEPTDLYTIQEKVSGTVKHTKRKLHELLELCEKGSTIYISELSRLGRSMNDLFSIVSYAGEKEITLIQCKDGTTIENKSIGGKALLFALSLAAEIEVDNNRQRTKMGIAARKARNEAVGGTDELWGKNTGANRVEVMEKMRIVSVDKKKENARKNPNNIHFWTFIQKWMRNNPEPKSCETWQIIADELNEFKFKTSTGLEYNASRAAAMYRNLKKIMQ